MALQGYLTKVRISGSPTTLTSEPMSAYSTVAHTFQANTSSKRIFSSTAAVTFKSGSHTLSTSEYTTINYLFGAVTLTSAFAGSTVFTGTIKASGKYLPTSAVGGAHSYQLNQTAVLLDDTDYTSTGWTSRIPGLKDVSLSLSKFDDLSTAFYKLINTDTPVIVEIRPGGVGNAARGWFLVESENRSGAVAGIESADLKFSLANKVGIGSWAWGAP